MTASPNLIVNAGHTPVSLRMSLLAGFIGFAFQLSLNYILRSHACHAQSQAVLHAVNTGAFLLAVLGTLLGFYVLRNLPPEKDEQGGEPHDRAHFQTLLAIGFNLGFGVAILALSIPAWLVQPC